ncbi:MAG: hypothetical protein ACR2MD_00990 [Aridibacter sp.]
MENNSKVKIIKKRNFERDKTLRETLNELRGELLVSLAKVDILLKSEKNSLTEGKN